MKKLPKIVLLGGGTGSFTLLQSLKKITPNISAVVNMSDDGGSTGELRDEFGVLPPGDARQCLVALSDSKELRDLFSYRFGGKGALAGHTVGNLLLTGLELQQGSFEQAIKIASSILRIKGKVIPATLDKHTVVLKSSKNIIEGEYKIGHSKILPGSTISLKPKASLNPDAKKSFQSADYIIIAPGNLYGSLLPLLSINGMKTAFKKSSAKKIMVTNLVTKPGQTDGWHVVDYLNEIEKYIGSKQIEFVLYNNDLPSKELLKKYAAAGEFPVDIAKNKFSSGHANFIGSKLVSDTIASQDPNDKAIRRTYIRHDADAVVKQLLKILD